MYRAGIIAKLRRCGQRSRTALPLEMMIKVIPSGADNTPEPDMSNHYAIEICIIGGSAVIRLNPCIDAQLSR
jgi:hypothetical protein